jgi:hypothetical protein
LAEIEWKGAVWRAAYGNYSIKELLTILKGYGPMELLEFEKPGRFRGQISLTLSEEGRKGITLYHLEVLGPERQGQGRAALEWLREIFKGELFVEDPGKLIRVKNADDASLPFWIKMFREGVIDALDSDRCKLHSNMTREEVDEALKDRGLTEASDTSSSQIP